MWTFPSTPCTFLSLPDKAEDQPDVNVVLSAYSQQGDPALYEVYYSGLKRFIESVLDCHRAELSQVFYPLFVHMYLELVYNNHENEAKAFFQKWAQYFIIISAYLNLFLRDPHSFL